MPTTSSKPVSKKEIESKTPRKSSTQIVNEQAALQKIEKFKKILQTKGRTLSAADWRLHDELLETYVRLKQESINGTLIRIPPRTRLKVNLPSFCLNSDRAAPIEGERYRWVKRSPGIPYFSEILKLSASKDINLSNAQTLLWNLQNKTEWENYPEHLKAILRKIDPNAAIKLPSKLKTKAQDAALDYIKSQIPLSQEVENKLAFLEGQYYQYEDYANNVRSLRSTQELEDSDDLVSIPDSPVAAEIRSQGFSSQEVTFYNPTDSAQEFNLTDYYLQPVRKDVQRIGLTGPGSSSSELLSRLEEVLYQNMARLGVGFTPIVGDVADLYELLIGKDFLTGENLDWSGRMLSGIGLLAGSGAGYRYAMRAAHAPGEFLPQFEKGFERIAKKEIHLADQSKLSSALNELTILKTSEGTIPRRRRGLYQKFQLANKKWPIPSEADLI